MTKKSHKPVKPCEGCELNLGERCAAFDYPAEQWLHHPCKGYNNPELIARYLPHNDGEGAHARKKARKVDAKANEQVQQHGETRTNFKKIKFP
ncbi:MAG TPA: hypothetical protein VEK06_03495 [Myxococcota bacterium]|nr:hypothetical protein [Myxococcota bacterium]